MVEMLAGLENNSIITADAVDRLKSYISRKHSSLSMQRRAVILADALNKAIEARLPRFEEVLCRKLKSLLFQHVVRKPIFEIYCSDVFQAAVELKETNEVFFSELDSWLSKNLKESISRKQLIELVLETHRLVELYPEMSIADAFAFQENFGNGHGDRYLVPSAEMGQGTCPHVHSWIVSEDREPSIIFGQLSEVFKKSRVRARNKNILAAAAAVIFLFGAPFLLKLDSRNHNENIEASLDLNYSTGALMLSDLTGQSSDTTEVSDVLNENDTDHKLQMKATAYDLSVASCGKLPGEPGYGITSSGTKAVVGRTVAVDPEVIPLGSRLLITFPHEYRHLDGVYIAEDTGSMIKGSSIDIFFGEDKKGSTDVYNKAMKFGVRVVNVKILPDSGKVS